MKHIVIIGGGLSGSLCAIHLLKQNTAPVSITILEQHKNQLSRGAAYSSRLPHQLLNVPVHGMSLFEDQPHHFEEWIEKEYPGQYGAHDFAPRNIFGAYLETHFQEALHNSEHACRLINDEVTDIQQGATGYQVYTKNGESVYADSVLLCTGNLPPHQLAHLNKDALEYPQYIQNPWSGNYLQQIKKDETVLLAGTGLTMVDQLLSLYKNGHEGKIWLVSRRGLLPRAHDKAPDYQLQFQDQFDTTTVLGCLQWFRAEKKQAELEDANWISVFNAIRVQTPLLWQQFSKEEKRRFLRHLKPYWEVHRHRIPKQSHEIIQQLMAIGQAEVIAGRMQQVSHNGTHFHFSILSKGKREQIEIATDWLVNCTGPNIHIRETGNTLLKNLLRNGILKTDEVSLGLETEERHNNIFIVGPPAKGTYWECTALREIRKHADCVAKEIVNRGVFAQQRTATALM